VLSTVWLASHTFARALSYLGNGIAVPSLLLLWEGGSREVLSSDPGQALGQIIATFEDLKRSLELMRDGCSITAHSRLEGNKAHLACGRPKLIRMCMLTASGRVVRVVACELGGSLTPPSVIKSHPE
jgi:hypothetical protein